MPWVLYGWRGVRKMSDKCRLTWVRFEH